MVVSELAEPSTRFKYLGTLECWLGGQPVEIRGATQRALLATLLASSSAPISVDALMEELWGENPPARAENALQAHISRLRRKLSKQSHDPAVSLVTLQTGYRLLVDEDLVDGKVFMRTLDRVRSSPQMRPSEAVALLRGALELWRGAVFGGPIGGPICQATAARFEAARNVAEETLYDLELRRGRHVEAIPELRALVEWQPLNERFCEQLMVALYRSGRQTEALEAYRRIRDRLDVELGMEPSPMLRAYERAVLVHDPALSVGADYTAVRAPESTR